MTSHRVNGNLKYCKTCKCWKQLDQFCKQGKWFSSVCKLCQNQAAHERALGRNATRVCKVCGQKKHFRQFALLYGRRSYTCKDCYTPLPPHPRLPDLAYLEPAGIPPRCDEFERRRIAGWLRAKGSGQYDYEWGLR